MECAPSLSAFPLLLMAVALLDHDTVRAATGRFAAFRVTSPFPWVTRPRWNVFNRDTISPLVLVGIQKPTGHPP